MNKSRMNRGILVVGIMIAFSILAGGIVNATPASAYEVGVNVGKVSENPFQERSTTYCSAYGWHGDIRLTVQGYKRSSNTSDIVANPYKKSTNGYKVLLKFVGVFPANAGVIAIWDTWHKGYLGNGQVGWVSDGQKSVSCYYDGISV